MLRAFVGVTDNDWFAFLAGLPGIDEVNFWQPSGSQRFKSLSPGEPFLFKLHSPLNYIAGGGFFAYSNICPLSLAWDAFGEKNGVSSLLEMSKRIGKYRGRVPSLAEDYQIGCILLEQPFFFPRDQWIPAPEDWKPEIVQGKGYDLTKGIGKRLWEEVQLRLYGGAQLGKEREIPIEKGRYGTPTLVIPRLGQGSFRIIVTDAYQRRCAVTQERTLPALEAAHIKPDKDSGPLIVNNGVLLRSDIHRLFDTGYVTISPEYHFEVSRRIKEEYENGRDYYAMHGRQLHLPMPEQLRPSLKFITWHNENVFRS